MVPGILPNWDVVHGPNQLANTTFHGVRIRISLSVTYGVLHALKLSDGKIVET